MSSLTVSSSSFMYISKPTESIWPLCCAAEQVAGAADLEVERRDAEAAAQVAELLDRGQAPLGHRRQRLLGRNHQVGVGRPVAAADPAAQLVELRQTVAVGAVDDDGVGVGDVEAVLDDRRRQQHVELVGHEVEHRALERVLAHLAVADDDARLGHQPLEQVGHRVDRLDAVVDDEDLAAAGQLGAQRPADHVLVELDDVGLDRQPILGRRSRSPTCRGCRPATCGACAGSASRSASARRPCGASA